MNGLASTSSPRVQGRPERSGRRRDASAPTTTTRAATGVAGAGGGSHAAGPAA